MSSAASVRVMEPTAKQESDELLRLYSKRILALTADLADARRLKNPHASVMKRSPLCGSTVTVDVRVEGGLVSAYGQDVKACALGQASAAVLGKQAIGKSLGELREARDTLRAMLNGAAPAPSGAFADLEALLPAREFRNRHASIMLAYDAAAEAVEMASVAPPA